MEHAAQHQAPAAAPKRVMLPLTGRQREILAFIEMSIKMCGIPPSRVEIAEAFGFRSPNAAEDHLKALHRKGAIDLVPGIARGIRLPIPTNAPSLTQP